MAVLSRPSGTGFGVPDILQSKVSFAQPPHLKSETWGTHLWEAANWAVLR
jgi:hypothetical protein